MTPSKLSALILCALFACAPLAPAVSAVTLSPRASAQQEDTPSDAEQAMFTRGQRLYNDGRYEQASGVFKDFLKTYPNSIIYDLTLLWLGRSYIALNRLPEAEQVAQQLRNIKDTPFVEIYDGELQAARRESARRGSEGVRPAPQQSAPTQVAANVAPRTRATPTPSPTPRRVATITDQSAARRRTPAPTPTPSRAPSLVSEARPTETAGAAGSNAPAPTATPSAQSSPARRGYGRRPRSTRGAQQSAAMGAQQTAANNPPATTSTTGAQTAASQPTPRPTPLPRPTPTQRAAAPQPTPRRTEIARNTPPVASTPQPSPAPSRAEPSVSASSSAPVTNAAPGEQGGAAFTVKQVPNLSLALRRAALAASPGQSVQLPLTVTNAGNKEDQFRLETDLPAEFQPTFSLASGGQDSGLPILVTPVLTRGQTLDVLLNVRVPETATDGMQRRFIVRAASQADFQVSKFEDASMMVVAAALAGTSAVGRDSVQPGETFTQTISVRNRGSASAESARADFVFSPDFELVNADPLPLFYDSASRTAVWSLGDLASNGTRDIKVTLRAVADALAANRTVGRGIMRTKSLPVPSNFDGPTINVGRVPRARIEAVTAGLTATPGDVMYLPFVVRNPGNYPESYELRITAPGAPTATIYADTNGDGQHQDNEPAVTQTTALDPRGGQFPLLLRVEVPRTTPDRQQFAYNLVARAAQSNRAASEATTVLTVATPRVRVRTEQVTDESAPGDVSFYRLVLVNDGGGLAKNITVTESLPAALALVDTNPHVTTDATAGGGQRVVWKVNELAPGDTAVLLVTVKLRPDLAAGGTITTTRTWVYQDANGNTYQNQ
ncbi:MAG: DUF11 domain-containing protein [Acidobacteria bacterium]|nr:DUF11 domain-containing protein [Acidobacteriota bacterium]